MIIKDHGLSGAILGELDRILGQGCWALYRERGLRPERMHPPESWELRRRVAGITPLELIATWRLEQFPGSQWYGVSTHVRVEPQWRCKGLGHLTLKIREDLALKLGYRTLLATVLATNFQERRILARAGWHTKVGDFYGDLWGKELDCPEVDPDAHLGGVRD